MLSTCNIRDGTMPTTVGIAMLITASFGALHLQNKAFASTANNVLERRNTHERETDPQGKTWTVWSYDVTTASILTFSQRLQDQSLPKVKSRTHITVIGFNFTPSYNIENTSF